MTGADPSGRYVAGFGVSDRNDNKQTPVIWDNGVLSIISLPGVSQQINDLNTAGVAVATTRGVPPILTPKPWVIRDGIARELPGVAFADARAVNDHGDVVGTTQQGRAVFWPAVEEGNGSAVLLPMPVGAVRTAAADIDENGTIVGSYQDADRIVHAVAWLPDGEIYVLPSGPGASEESNAEAIRGGWIIGLAESAEHGATPARWPKAGQPQLFDEFEQVRGVNASGWMVGAGYDRRGLLWNGSQYVVLPGLKEEPNEFSDVATHISDDQLAIAGHASDKDGNLHAVRWTCD